MSHLAINQSRLGRFYWLLSFLVTYHTFAKNKYNQTSQFSLLNKA